MFVASGVIFFFAAIAVCLIGGLLIGLCYMIASTDDDFGFFRKIARVLMVISGVLVLGLIYLTFFGFSFFGYV